MRERLALSVDPKPYFNLQIYEPKSAKYNRRCQSKHADSMFQPINECNFDESQNHEQAEESLELFDLIKEFNKMKTPKIEPSKEEKDVVYFEDSFLAKDYVPYVPFDGFIPNRRDESENEGKVLRFKWTEKLEKVTTSLFSFF